MIPKENSCSQSESGRTIPITSHRGELGIDSSKNTLNKCCKVKDDGAMRLLFEPLNAACAVAKRPKHRKRSYRNHSNQQMTITLMTMRNIHTQHGFAPKGDPYMHKTDVKRVSQLMQRLPAREFADATRSTTTTKERAVNDFCS